MAASDSNAFFHDLAVGADADVSGVVALIAAANALSKVMILISSSCFLEREKEKEKEL